MEEWKNIKGYEGYYIISNRGNVRSLDRIIKYPDGHTQFYKGKEISKTLTKWGYLQVKLCKNSICKRKHVHDLVAEAFIPNPNSLNEVNHIDHNKTNNNTNNLEWVTHKENIKDMVIYKGINRTDEGYLCPICMKPKSYDAIMCQECRKEKRKEKRKINSPVKKPNIKNKLQKSDICPICGGIKSKNANTCYKCSPILRTSKKKPSKDELKQSLARGLNYTEISKLYEVSPNCIKKWCKSYDIPLPIFIYKPSKETLIQLLQNNTKKEVASLLGAHTATVTEWIRDYNISVIKNVSILCIENNITFDSFDKARQYIKTQASLETFRDILQKSNRTGQKCYGYTWKITKTFLYK